MKSAELAAIFEEAALRAGKAIMEVYASERTARFKSDKSPVTEADEAAEAIIAELLNAAFPTIPVIAEEAFSAGTCPAVGPTDTFFLVDPLDGTKEFISGGKDFTVNIGLIQQGTPVAGIVYAPALNTAYIACGSEATKLSVLNFAVVARTRLVTPATLGCRSAVASKSHSTPQTEAFLNAVGVSERISIGSSLKFCVVAEGDADLYPRFGRTMEWDTAAGDAILRAAGGVTVTLDGTPLQYGKVCQTTDSDFANCQFIALKNDRLTHGIVESISMLDATQLGGG